MLAESDLGRWLGTVEAGRPACVFADDVEDVRSALEQLVTSEREPARVVALSWSEVPSLGSELGLLVNALARATVELFPELYGFTQQSRGCWTEADVETEVHAITRRLPEVFGPACRQILLACRKGQLPLVRKMSNSEQVRQLALAIEPRRLVVLIAVLNRTANPMGLKALALGTEWLASNTNSRVILTVPSKFRNAQELDHVTYTACLFAQATHGSDTTPARGEPVNVGPEPAATTSSSTEEADLFVSAVVGRPHPRSDAEKELHRRITADSDLRPLFAYNQPVTTRFDTRPTVDLLWEAGQLVIEIDGPDHRGEQKFAQDRRRDFELLMSGYRVARFTSSSVIEQTDTVIDQIRAAVRYFGRREKE